MINLHRMKTLVYILSSFHFVKLQQDNLVESKSNCTNEMLESILGLDDQQLSDISSFETQNLWKNNNIQVFSFTV